MPDRTATLLRAASEVLHAPDEASALQVIAQAVHDDGWHSVIVHSYAANWHIAHTAFINVPDEERKALDAHAMTPDERAATFGPKYEPFRVGKSYFFPAERPGARIIRTMHLPGSAGETPGDWHPDDAAYIPMRDPDDRVIGRITIDGPVDGRRPDGATLRKLEAFADLAALGITRLRAQQRQRDAEHTVTAMMDAVGALIWLTYDEDRPSYFNEEWYRFTGCPRDDHELFVFSRYCHPDDLPEVRRSYRAAVAARTPWAGEYRLRKYDGSYAWMLERARPLYSATGDYVGHVCTAVDVSAERSAAEQLQRERDHLAMAIDASGGGCWEASYSGNEPPNALPLVRNIDQRILDIVGYQQSDFPGGHGWDRIVHPDDKLAKAQQDEEDSVDHAHRRSREYRVIHKDGSVRWIRSSYLTRSNERGLPLRQVGFVMDITEQKRAADELKRERDRLSIALQAAGAGLWEGTVPGDPTQKHGEILYASPRIAAIAGYPAGWPSSHDDWDAIVHPDDKAAKERQDAQHLQGGMPHVSRDYRIYHKDGSIRWVRTAYITVKERGGSGRTVGVVMDITEQKRTEQSLQREHDRLALAIEASGGALWESDFGGPGPTGQPVYTFRSARMGEIAGYADGVWPRSHDDWDALVLPQDRHDKERQDAAHARGELANVTREYRIRHKDGSIRWVRSCYLTRAESGEPRSVGFIMDVTNERLASERLQRERDRLALAIEASGGGINDVEWVNAGSMDDDVPLTTVSTRICDLLGYTTDEMATVAAWQRIVHPDDRLRNEAQNRAHIDGKLPRVTRDTRVICKDGSTKWLRASFLTRRDTDDRPVYSVAFVMDITDQKRAEAELRRQAACMQAIVNAVPDALITCDLDRRIQYVNPKFTELFGYEPCAALGKDTRFFYANPSDFDELGRVRFSRTVPPSHVPYEIQYRRSDGTTFHAETVGGVYKDHAGTPIGFLGLVRDISARKETEGRLRDLLDRERVLVAELDHRVRNALGGLLSLIDLTARSTESAIACAETLSRRVRSMVTAHDLMSATRWRPVDLRVLLHRLLPADTPGGLALDGPPAQIPARQATAFAMIIHELIANSLKHGALGVTGGQVHVKWDIRSAPDAVGRTRLVLRWVESGGPTPSTHPRIGLGTQLITGFARSELAGQATLNFTATGAQHIIEACLDHDDAGSHYSEPAVVLL